MVKTETQIWLALKEHLEAYQTTIPKAMPAEFFEIKNHPSFMRVGFTMDEPKRLTIDDDPIQERRGALIVTIAQRIRKDIDNMARRLQIAGDLAEHFKCDTALLRGNICVNIPTQPTIAPGYEEEGFWNIRVTIRWVVYGL